MRSARSARGSSVFTSEAAPPPQPIAQGLSSPERPASQAVLDPGGELGLGAERGLSSLHHPCTLPSAVSSSRRPTRSPLSRRPTPSPLSQRPPPPVVALRVSRSLATLRRGADDRPRTFAAAAAPPNADVSASASASGLGGGRSGGEQGGGSGSGIDCGAAWLFSFASAATLVPIRNADGTAVSRTLRAYLRGGHTLQPCTSQAPDQVPPPIEDAPAGAPARSVSVVRLPHGLGRTL